MDRFRDILYLATGPGIPPGLGRAAALTRAHGGALTIARVVEAAEVGRGGERAARGVEGAVHEEEVGALAGSVEAMGVRVRTRVLRGPLLGSVIEAVREDGHDLVMKEAEEGRGGILRRLRGGPDERLMRACPCPVWLHGRGGSGSLRSVLAAVDPTPGEGRELGGHVIRVASSLAAREGAALHVVHAWSLQSEALFRARARGHQRARLRALLRATRRKREESLESLLAAEVVGGVEAQPHLVKGPAVAAIDGMAERVEADLVVLGTAGRRGIQGLLIGNTAEWVRPRLRASVLTVSLAGAAVRAGLPAGPRGRRDTASRRRRGVERPPAGSPVGDGRAPGFGGAMVVTPGGTGGGA